MHSRLVTKSFFRYAHGKTRLPELDFTKPTSDRLKRSSFSNRLTSTNDDQQSLLKVPLRGQCLFGLHPIELALKMKRRQFHQLYLSHTSNDHRPTMQTIQQLAEQLSVPIQHTTTDVLDRLAFDRPHQGVCLDCSPLSIPDIQQAELEQTDSTALFLDLCLVKINDPMNFGAMLRTAHFFGVKRVLLTQGTCQPSPVASKASSGALELMSMYTCQNFEAYLKLLRDEENVALICATHHGEIPLSTLRLDAIKETWPTSTPLKRLVVLVGNEHSGIPDDISRLCHFNVCIQANDESEISSLNASVACALFLYHLSAQMNRVNN